MATQFTIEGREEDYEAVVNRRRTLTRLTGLQAEILATIRREGSIRAFVAGVMVHAERNARMHRRCSGGGKGWGPTRTGACCHYAATDGYEMMKRLRKRGLVKQRRDKAWVLR